MVLMFAASYDEIVINSKKRVTIFDFPLKFYKKYLADKLKFVKVLSIKRKYSYYSGPRILVKVNKKDADEIRAYLLVVLSEDYDWNLLEYEENSIE